MKGCEYCSRRPGSSPGVFEHLNNAIREKRLQAKLLEKTPREVPAKAGQHCPIQYQMVAPERTKGHTAEDEPHGKDHGWSEESFHAGYESV